MSEWNERTHEVQARYISAAHLIDTDEIAVLAPEVPLPEDHNCDAMGCGSMSHVAFRAPRDVMGRMDECEDKLREAEAELAEALKRIAELEAELTQVRAQRDQVCDEYDTFQCDIASAFILP